MSDIPDNLRYTEEHEYIKAADEDDVAYIGITDYAQGELGDIVFVELPEPGETFDRGTVFGTIEAVKAVSELYTPVSCEVLEANPALTGNEGLINQDPYGQGWMIKVRLQSPDELDQTLSHADYAQHIGE